MSDLDAYRSLYVAESRENLEAVVSNLLILEQGTDSTAIDEIFRSAHSLKGMSASMGFMHMEEICHALEDVFSQIRAGILTTSQSIVDDLLAGTDDIEQMIDDIEAGGDGILPNIDERVTALKKWMDVTEKDKKGKTTQSPKVEEQIQVSTTETDMYAVPPYELKDQKGMEVFELHIVLASDVENRNLRGMLILQNLESIGVFNKISPDREKIEDDSDFDGVMNIEFASNAGEEALSTILSVSDIGERSINCISESVNDKEEAKNTSIQASTHKYRYAVHVEISSSVDSKNLRTMLLLQNVQNKGNIENISPTLEVIEDSEGFNGIFDLTLTSDLEKEDLEKVFEISDIKSFLVNHLNKETKSEDTVSEVSENPIESEKTRSISPIEKTEKKREVKNIRVDIDRLDHMMNLVEDLVINRGRLEQIADKHKIKELDETLNMVSRSVSDLQVMMMDIRMIPLNQIFNRFPRTVRDIATKEGKEVEFIIEGGETELDRSVMDGLNDPLLHLIRNGIDHGIEPPEVRIKNGKAPKGFLKLSAARDKDNVVIVIEDDGAGINTEKVKRKGIERGVITEEMAAQMSDSEVNDLLFLPGFSTAEKITDISGRGVGLDVVKTIISGLQGTIKLESELNHGSRFELVLPPTMAIVMVMMIRINGRRCAIPITNVGEVASLAAFPIQNIGHGEGILMRDEIIILYRLDDMFGRSSNEEVIIVIQDGMKKGALIADLIEGQQEVVIKPLSKFVGTCEGVSGVTIPGDGEVVPVLDVKGVLHMGATLKGAKKKL